MHLDAEGRDLDGERSRAFEYAFVDLVLLVLTRQPTVFVVQCPRHRRLRFDGLAACQPFPGNASRWLGRALSWSGPHYAGFVIGWTLGF